MEVIARPLTSGEIALARLVFGSAIDYKRVRIHNTRFIPFLQRKDVCITPNGELYFHISRYRPDFSLASESEQHWFMHEMVCISNGRNTRMAKFLEMDSASTLLI
jgi:hypothetical protein